MLGLRGDTPQPVPVVQCSGISKEEGWITVLLHGLLQTQYTYQKGLLSLATDPGSLESMMGPAHFSTMDFKSRFWQVKMVPEFQQYTAFTIGNLGFYEFTHMPFGLCNALVTFQHLMQNTLGELNLTYCVIYLDDVIVFGHTEEEHLECLHIIFKCFHEFNLKLKPSKCSFFQSEIVYLVHHVSREGIHSSRENMWVIGEFPMLETFTPVQPFCGLVEHYRYFIRGFTHIVRPLYGMMGKEVKMGPVRLPPEVQEVVRILKDKIQSTPW